MKNTKVIWTKQNVLRFNFVSQPGILCLWKEFRRKPWLFLLLALFVFLFLFPTAEKVGKLLCNPKEQRNTRCICSTCNNSRPMCVPSQWPFLDVLWNVVNLFQVLKENNSTDNWFSWLGFYFILLNGILWSWSWHWGVFIHCLLFWMISGLLQ